MRDGCCITLDHTTIINSITYYHLEVRTEGVEYSTNYRYSKLRTIAEKLPKVALYYMKT